MRKRHLCIISIILLLWSCNDNNSQKESLDKINEISKSNPSLALTMLDSIDHSNLAEKERHFYDFITIKANNFADKHITSDSLMLDIMEYYSREDREGLQAEILFHAGILYDNLGDKPTALKYLQQSLDKLPSETSQKELREDVIGAVGELLFSIRLYGEAEPYLTESVETATLIGDSIKMMNHTYLLGLIKTDARRFKDAEKYFIKSRNIAKNISPRDTLRCDLNLFSIKATVTKKDSVFSKLYNNIHNNKDSIRNKALTNIAGIYFRDDILKVVFKYAQDSTHKITPEIVNFAYDMFTPELKQFISQDSLGFYMKKYSHILEKCFNMFLAEPTRFQNSSYNYSLHERERLKAEERNAKLQKWLGVSIMVLLLLIIAILFLKYRNKSNILKLHEALDDLAALKNSLNHSSTSNPEATEEKEELKESCAEASDSSRIENLKKRLKNQLIELRANCSGKYEVPSGILSSEAYARLKDYISAGRAIPETSSFWNELDKTVTQCSPDLKYRLQLLTGGHLKPTDYHLALLIKCGVTPTELTILVARTKGTISYRRQALCKRIFNENLGANAIDSIIHLL